MNCHVGARQSRRAFFPIQNWQTPEIRFAINRTASKPLRFRYCREENAWIYPPPILSRSSLDGEDVIANVDINLVVLYTRQFCFGYNLVLLKFK